MTPLVELRDVRRRFSVHGQALEVLRGVDLTIAAGERVGITGSSGSGKSTLLAILGLIDASFEGAYLLRGANVRESSETEWSRWRLREYGFAFQDLNLVPSLSAAENVALPTIAAGTGEAQALERAHALLEAAGLAARARHRPSELSGGERRRVALARALANRPKILLVDEPTSELDDVSAAGVLALIEQALDKGSTLVAATHDPRLLRLCTTHHALVKGRLRSKEEAETKG